MPVLQIPSPPNAQSTDDQHLDTVEFERLVRDALAHLYDTVYLQTHALAQVVQRAEPQALHSLLGKTLYKCLLDGIDTVRPAAGTSSMSKAMLRYRIMELRFIEGLDAPTVQRELAISKSEYYREHGRALEAVASALWDRWMIAQQMQPGAPSLGDHSPSPLQQEAGTLISAHRIERLDLNGLVGDVVALLTPLADRRGVTLNAVLPPALPPCWGDRIVVRQALLSVMHHAVDSAALGTVEVRVAPAPATRLIVTAVRAPGTSTSWTGFDAATTHELVGGIGGRLEYVTVHGGFAVEIVLPPKRRRTVLVVDNNADFVALIGRYLEQHGWMVVGGCGLEAALALVTQCSPDIILLDVLMPGQDGWEVLRALRDTPHTELVPVVICSVLNEPQLALDLGANAYLPKPVRQSDLLHLLAAQCSSMPEGEEDSPAVPGARR
jgi:CheY-like chemotaxis protein